MRPLLAVVAICASLFFGSSSCSAQTGTPSEMNDGIDSHLAQVIATTLAFDNHAHPVLSPPDDRADRGFDALPVDSMEPQTDPVALRPDFPALHDAWKTLYGLDLQPPLDSMGQQKLEAARNVLKKREGQQYSSYILRQASIGTQVANRVSMGTGVRSPYFLWVPYDDALLVPLSTRTLASENPDRAIFFPLEDRMRERYLSALGLRTLPEDLDSYLLQVVYPTLQQQKAAGAIAVKFELAYLRKLDVGKPSKAEAAAVYALGARAGSPGLTAAQYKPLQDYLFRAIAAKCGEFGLAVHFHAMAGAGSYFDSAGANPLNMEPVFNDPAMRHTNFVILHGGWPYVREAGALLLKPNVYLDFSQQALVIPARTLASWLREYLEMYPEKVLFATDGYPYAPFMGWEESTWLAAQNGRHALAIALSGMLHDREISPERADQLARMVLRGNAETLYKRKTAQ